MLLDQSNEFRQQSALRLTARPLCPVRAPEEAVPRRQRLSHCILLPQAAKEEASKAVIEEGTKYLEENAKRDEVTVTESGLQYEVIAEGDGETPVAASTVRVHYHGTLINGTTFDSSYERGQPAEFPVGGVIKGWTEALQLMKVGAKYRLYVPHDLAYGEQGAGAAIAPYSTLIFDVELLDVLG